uniref:Uncharacterized protein n=1 Tax=Arundo donax TaxID=35708 RepID=A0A0A9H0U7_ARUDO
MVLTYIKYITCHTRTIFLFMQTEQAVKDNNGASSSYTFKGSKLTNPSWNNA